jgi:hypothetical protein
MSTKTKPAAEAESDVVDADAELVEDETDLSEAIEATPQEVEALIAAESQAVAIRDERDHAYQPVHALPSPGEWEATMTMARTIASTPFVPPGYRGQPEAVVAGILYGREIGLGPMQALQKIHMIDGRPSMSADLMLGQMRRGGLVILESVSTNERAWIRAKRTDTGEVGEVEWTIEEARLIRTKERNREITLAEKGTWLAYPADMLWARCVGRLARHLGSDLLGGMVYSSEEIADWGEGDYGGSGYSTGTVAEKKMPTTSDGVVMREGAPLGWKAITETTTQIDASMDWKTWVSQALTSLVGKAGFADLDEQEKIDCGIKVANGIGHLLDTLAGRDFPPPNRDEIQAAFAWADAIDVKLEGPPDPLSPEEATGSAVSDPPKEEASSLGEGADGAEDASDAPLGPMPKNTTDDIPFGEEGK